MLSHFVELLSPLGSIRSRAMFGGHGLYCDELFIAVVIDDQLYLKVDALTEAAFVGAGSAPFIYQGQAKAMPMSYWSVPDDALESPQDMRPWAERAIQAALRKPLKAPKSARNKGKRVAAAPSEG